jgi:hypothetical protein
MADYLLYRCGASCQAVKREGKEGQTIRAQVEIGELSLLFLLPSPPPPTLTIGSARGRRCRSSSAMSVPNVCSTRRISNHGRRRLKRSSGVVAQSRRTITTSDEHNNNNNNSGAETLPAGICCHLCGERIALCCVYSERRAHIARGGEEGHKKKRGSVRRRAIHTHTTAPCSFMRLLPSPSFSDSGKRGGDMPSAHAAVWE